MFESQYYTKQQHTWRLSIGKKPPMIIPLWFFHKFISRFLLDISPAILKHHNANSYTLTIDY